MRLPGSWRPVEALVEPQEHRIIADATVTDIPGLDHSAFDDYGLQRDDGLSAVTMDRVVELIAERLR